MSGVDVLAVLKRHLALAKLVGSDAQIAEAREVLASVDELIAAAENMAHGWPLNPGDQKLIRAAVYRCGGQP